MSEPRKLGNILQDYFQNSQEPLAVEFRRHFNIKPIVNLDLVSDEMLNGMAEKAFLEDWIDNQIVMQRLHISLRTLQTLRSNGTLPYTRVNGKIYYLRQDVEKLLRQNYGFKGGKE